MIRVIVEIVPGGVGPARHVRQFEIANVTGVDTRYADYAVRGLGPVVRLRHHDREQSIIVLVRNALSAVIKKERRRASAQARSDHPTGPAQAGTHTTTDRSDTAPPTHQGAALPGA